MTGCRRGFLDTRWLQTWSSVDLMVGVGRSSLEEEESGVETDSGG